MKTTAADEYGNASGRDQHPWKDVHIVGVFLFATRHCGDAA
jgi:hypothetical protein